MYLVQPKQLEDSLQLKVGLYHKMVCFKLLGFWLNFLLLFWPLFTSFISLANFATWNLFSSLPQCLVYLPYAWWYSIRSVSILWHKVVYIRSDVGKSCYVFNTWCFLVPCAATTCAGGRRRAKYVANPWCNYFSSVISSNDSGRHWRICTSDSGGAC